MPIAHEPGPLKLANPNQARFLCHIGTFLFQADPDPDELWPLGHNHLFRKGFLVNRPVTIKRLRPAAFTPGQQAGKTCKRKIAPGSGVVRAVGLEPTLPKDGDFKSPVSTIPPSARTVWLPYWHTRTIRHNTMCHRKQSVYFQQMEAGVEPRRGGLGRPCRAMLPRHVRTRASRRRLC